MSQDTFCVLPWMHIATNASGNLRVCCNSIPGQNYIMKNPDHPFKIYKDDLEIAWRSDTYKEIRKQFLNNERPKMCTRCFREEDAGVRSARQAWNDKWREDKEYTENPPFDIKYIDLRLGNLCNLKCRMCNPHASNQWVREWHLIADALSDYDFNRLKNMNWPEDAKTWENVMKVVDTIDTIYLTGGEPTIIGAQHILLDFLIENDKAKKIKLKYNTNLTNIPRHLIDKWKEFKRIQLNASIDAYGDLDNYIRFPSNWEKIVENFDILSRVRNVYPEIHCTVQMYNILYLHQFIEWAKPYNVKIYFNILNHPEELNIRVLPNHLKEEAEKRLQPYLNLEKVSGIIKYMWAEDWHDKYYSKFINYTKALDKSRKQNILDYVEEFKDGFS